MTRNKKTSKKVLSKASKVLRDRKASADEKAAAGSALIKTADRSKKKNK